LQAEIEKWMSVAGKWDEPQVDTRMLKSRVDDGELGCPRLTEKTS
jgi:hypothetical protein